MLDVLSNAPGGQGSTYFMSLRVTWLTCRAYGPWGRTLWALVLPHVFLCHHDVGRLWVWAFPTQTTSRTTCPAWTSTCAPLSKRRTASLSCKLWPWSYQSFTMGSQAFRWVRRALQCNQELVAHGQRVIDCPCCTHDCPRRTSRRTE